MYEMLTGRQPFRAIPHCRGPEADSKTPIPLRQYLPDLHRDLEQLVMRLLAGSGAAPRDAEGVVRVLQRIERNWKQVTATSTVVLTAVDVPEQGG